MFKYDLTCYKGLCVVSMYGRENLNKNGRIKCHKRFQEGNIWTIFSFEYYLVLFIFDVIPCKFGVKQDKYIIMTFDAHELNLIQINELYLLRTT